MKKIDICTKFLEHNVKEQTDANAEEIALFKDICHDFNSVPYGFQGKCLNQQGESTLAIHCY